MKYFIVKKSNNPLFKKFINWLNKEYNQDWDGSCYKYYGYDGNNNCNGTEAWDNITKFENNPTLITLKEWEQLFILETPKIYELWT